MLGQPLRGRQHTHVDVDPIERGKSRMQALLPLSPIVISIKFSPCNTNAQLSAQVLRIKEMITRDELF